MSGFLNRRVLISIGAVTFLSGLLMVAVGLVSLLSSDGGSAASVRQPPTPTPSATSAAVTPSPSSTASPAPALSPTASSTPSPTPAPPLGDAPFRMVIDSIGVDAPVETYGLDVNAIPGVPTGPDAAEVVAWYDFSGEPGTGDNAVFSGHVTWFGRAVFWDLKKLELGDTITLRGDDGTELVYSVSDSFLVDPANPESVQVMKHMSEDVITLITCDGDFVDTGDPVFGGDYTSRRVIRASLVSVTTPNTPGGPYSGG